MRFLALRRARLIRPLSRFHARIAVLSVAIFAAAGLTAGLASAQSIPLGTGVVVINTNLAYQRGRAAGTGMVIRVLAGQGTAAAFIVVASVFLGLFLLSYVMRSFAFGRLTVLSLAPL